jgi:hypothetical protein
MAHEPVHTQCSAFLGVVLIFLVIIFLKNFFNEKISEKLSLKNELSGN